MSNDILEAIDSSKTIISIPRVNGKKSMPDLPESKILHVSDYLTDEPYLQNIEGLSTVFKRQCGYSDHTIGPDQCIKAIKLYGANVIEKHFHVGDVFKYEGIEFRDTIHAAQPKDLELIAKEMSK